jgi:hypothetical protein
VQIDVRDADQIEHMAAKTLDRFVRDALGRRDTAGLRESAHKFTGMVNSRENLRFAAESDGNEGASQTLYRAMVSYVEGANQFQPQE